MKYISLLPDLQSQVGHILDYHLALKEALARRGYSHEAWVPRACQIDLPASWSKLLLNPKRLYCNSRAHFLALQQVADPQNSILFLEHFRLIDLFALFWGLVFQKHRWKIWLLHRYSPLQMKCHGKLHALAYKFLRLKADLTFLTDSELLAEQLQSVLHQKLTVVPIPHGQPRTDKKFPKESHLIYCWWPGGATRPAKGLKHICHLSHLLAEHEAPIRLIVAKNSQAKGVIASPSVCFIDDELSREAYEMWMNTADITLLPYDPQVYGAATSGIFVEAISAGKLPLIHRNTWMEYEAKKFGLRELCIDWESPDILKQIEQIWQDREVKKQLKNMQQHYRSYHCIEKFSDVLESCHS
ncbi:MAG: glycosyltransferase [Chlamydiia bacterium]|nr:glycosyltransferase [Chlamydiia bacterium]